MRDFIEATNIDMWDIVKSGCEFPKILVDEVYQLKVKSLTPNECERISNCIISKKVWDTLEVAYVKTTQVKASKVHVLVSQYEMFKMEEE